MAPDSIRVGPARAARTRIYANHDLTEESMPRLKSFLLLFLFSIVLAPAASAQRRVTGRVTDQVSGAPVPGAAIQVQGTALGTSAADDGTFAISVPDGPLALIARRTAYQRREIPLPAGQQHADASLQ